MKTKNNKFKSLNILVKTFLLSIMLILNTNCSKNQVQENKSFVPITINPITIGKGSVNSHPYTQANFVINNDAEWQILLNNFNTVLNNNIVNTFIQTNVDFNNFQVIVAFYGENSSSSVKISNVIENVDNIVVTIQHSIGGTDDFASPFHIDKLLAL